MRQIALGSTDLMITDYCLGTMTWGNQTPEDDAHRQMDMALDAGIHHRRHRRDVSGEPGWRPRPWA